MIPIERNLQASNQINAGKPFVLVRGNSLKTTGYLQSMLVESDSLEESFESFIFDRQAQNLASGTITFYEVKLKLFLQYLEKIGINRITEITSHILREYLIYLEETHHNPGGIHAAFRAIKTFLNWWESEYEPDNWKNPIKKVRPPKVPVEILEPVSAKDVLALLKVCDIESLQGLRDCAIILTLMDTGVRASELVSISLHDLDLRNGKIIIRKGKGNKFRIVFISKKTQKAIHAYLSKRTDFTPFLWITKTKTQLKYSGLRQIIRRRSKDANIETPSLHSFRRYFALQMLRSGVDIFSLQKLMGHSDIQILRRYLQQTESDLRLAHQLGGPVNQLLGSVGFS